MLVITVMDQSEHNSRRVKFCIDRQCHQEFVSSSCINLYYRGKLISMAHSPEPNIYVHMHCKHPQNKINKV